MPNPELLRMLQQAGLNPQQAQAAAGFNEVLENPPMPGMDSSSPILKGLQQGGPAPQVAPPAQMHPAHQGLLQIIMDSLNPAKNEVKKLKPPNNIIGARG